MPPARAPPATKPHAPRWQRWRPPRCSCAASRCWRLLARRRQPWDEPFRRPLSLRSSGARGRPRRRRWSGMGGCGARPRRRARVPRRRASAPCWRCLRERRRRWRRPPPTGQSCWWHSCCTSTQRRGRRLSYVSCCSAASTPGTAPQRQSSCRWEPGQLDPVQGNSTACQTDCGCSSGTGCNRGPGGACCTCAAPCSPAPLLPGRCWRLPWRRAASWTPRPRCASAPPSARTGSWRTRLRCWQRTQQVGAWGPRHASACCTPPGQGMPHRAAASVPPPPGVQLFAPVVAAMCRPRG